MAFINDDYLPLHIPAFIRSLFGKQEHEHEDIERLQLALEPTRDYIHHMWRRLVRWHVDLYLGALDDPKVPPRSDNKRILYISAKEDASQVEEALGQARDALLRKIACGEIEGVSEADLPEIMLRQLPPLSEPVSFADNEHGLMYLPHPYVVPGPRFNEMYNWDTAFVVRGLLKDEKFDLAKAFVDNMLYQVEHYGTILNGNRTYYYDSNKSRSQPPLLTGKVLHIYECYDQLKQQQDQTATEWLEQAISICEAYYQHWVTSPHLHEESGLSLYSSDIGVPAFEVIHSESNHYDKALSKLREIYGKGLYQESPHTLTYQDRRDLYYLEQYYIPATETKSDKLSANFYRGDRAMRETGFDPSRRFGFFNVDVINYLPVCLNSLRYKMEKEMGEIYQILVENAPHSSQETTKDWQQKAKTWTKKSKKTAEAINDWIWDEGELDEHKNWIREPGYHDFNINTDLCTKYHIPQFRAYNFATSFYPMWMGIASKKQARETVERLLPKLQTEWGVMASSRRTGSQWDKPFLWAPLVVVTVEALETYAYYEEALTVAEGFLRLIEQDFARTGKLYEKYDAVRGTSDVSPMIKMGYSENVEGFAWTNSAVLELTEALNRLNNALNR